MSFVNKEEKEKKHFFFQCCRLNPGPQVEVKVEGKGKTKGGRERGRKKGRKEKERKEKKEGGKEGNSFTNIERWLLENRFPVEEPLLMEDEPDSITKQIWNPCNGWLSVHPLLTEHFDLSVFLRTTAQDEGASNKS